jgi:predicted O-methyltransferase YrrM
MDLFDNSLTRYLEDHADPENTLLQQINRETHLKETKAHMLSGHYQGRLLSLLSKMIGPKRILEVGTFTGYATLCLAEGLPAEGIIHTIDINEELEDRVKSYFEKSPFSKQIRYHIGNALDIIPTLHETFELAFIDADKKSNILYYEMIVETMPSGGIILIDNVLWKGKVLQENTDTQTEQILKLNQQIASDTRVEKIILPVRDGLLLVRKR